VVGRCIKRARRAVVPSHLTCIWRCCGPELSTLDTGDALRCPRRDRAGRRRRRVGWSRWRRRERVRQKSAPRNRSTFRSTVLLSTWTSLTAAGRSHPLVSRLCHITVPQLCYYLFIIHKMRHKNIRHTKIANKYKRTS